MAYSTNPITHYNNQRIHTALKMTPKAYAKMLDRYQTKQRYVFVEVGA